MLSYLLTNVIKNGFSICAPNQFGSCWRYSIAPNSYIGHDEWLDHKYGISGFRIIVC